MMHVRRTSLSFIAVLAIGCSAEIGEIASYTVIDSADVQIVENHRPNWSEPAPQILPTPQVTIGQVDGDGPHVFGRIAQAVLLGDGRIAVSDVLAREIRIFDVDGQHRQTLGKRGEGPGEFQSLGPVVPYVGDSLAVFDVRLRRTSVFSLGSGFARDFPLPVDGNYQLFGRLDGGAFLFFNPGQFRPELSPGLQWDSTDVVVIDPSGTTAQVVGRLPVLERLIGPGGRRETLNLMGLSIQATTDNGFYWATSDRYSITLYDRDGVVRRVIRRPANPREIDAAMRAEYRRALVDWVTRTQGESAVARFSGASDDARFARTLPLFATAFVDRNGRLWVADWPWPSAPGTAPSHWSLFTADGVWLGDLAAPPGTRIVDSDDDLVLGISQDSLGVQFVQVHRIERL